MTIKRITKVVLPGGMTNGMDMVSWVAGVARAQGWYAAEGYTKIIDAVGRGAWVAKAIN